MSIKIYVDKVLYENYYSLVHHIIKKEQLNLHLFLLPNNCITLTKNIKKILIPYYYYYYCLKNIAHEVKYLTHHDRTFFLISLSDQNINTYYYNNMFCDSFNLLTPTQKIKSNKVTTYYNLINKLNKNKNAGGYIIKSFYNRLPTNIKNKLYILNTKIGKYPVIVTL